MSPSIEEAIKHVEEFFSENFDDGVRSLDLVDEGSSSGLRIIAISLRNQSFRGYPYKCSIRGESDIGEEANYILNISVDKN